MKTDWISPLQTVQMGPDCVNVCPAQKKKDTAIIKPLLRSSGRCDGLFNSVRDNSTSVNCQPGRWVAEAGNAQSFPSPWRTANQGCICRSHKEAQEWEDGGGVERGFRWWTGRPFRSAEEPAWVASENMRKMPLDPWWWQSASPWSVHRLPRFHSHHIGLAPEKEKNSRNFVNVPHLFLRLHFLKVASCAQITHFRSALYKT